VELEEGRGECLNAEIFELEGTGDRDRPLLEERGEGEGEEDVLFLLLLEREP
jgi:hypothetical protein